MKQELQKKVDTAITLLRAAAGNDVVEVAYSGGKDSEVILELAKMSSIKYRAIYKNTTIDPPGTIKHCYEKGVEVVAPKMTFIDLVRKHGMPTRRARFCCRVLKEYKILDKAVHGVRRAESTARTKRYNEDDPIICRKYRGKNQHVNLILPILSWTLQDVTEFIDARGIKCHPIYYDEQGNFHGERRLGCIGCPLKSDNGRADFKMYPKMFRQICEAEIYWWHTHPQAKSHKKFGSPYGLIAHNIFYNKYAEWKADDINLFGQTDWKAFLEEYFCINLPNY